MGGSAGKARRYRGRWGKAEEHLLRGGGGGDERRALKGGGDLTGACLAENSGARMHCDGDDALSQAGVPATAEEFDLGELGHWERGGVAKS